MKKRMGSELNVEEQVASGRITGAGFALPRQAHNRAMTYPSRNGHIECLWAGHYPGTTTRRTGLVLTPTTTVTGRAYSRRLQWDRTCCPVMRLFKAEFDSRLDVLPTHGKAGASASATSATKQRLKKVAEAARATPGTEKVAEVGIFDAPTFPARRRGEISARLPVLAELVVALTLLRIGEDGIGLPNIFEFLFRSCVAGVDVRVILARQLTVGLLDFVRRRGARNTQGLIVVLELDSHSSWSLCWVMGQQTTYSVSKNTGFSDTLSLRHTHARRSQHLIAPPIPMAEFVEHNSRTYQIRFDSIDGVVQRRVKRLPSAGIGHHALRLQ